MYTLGYAFSAAPGLTVDSKLYAADGVFIEDATVLNSFEITGEYGITIQHSTQFQGYITFSNHANSDILAMFAVNPQEAENLDQPVSQLTVVGPGGYSKQVTVTDYLNVPLEGVGVWVTSDQAGQYTIAGTLYTDVIGHVTFLLPAGSWWVWRLSKNYTFDNPEALTVP